LNIARSICFEYQVSYHFDFFLHQNLVLNLLLNRYLEIVRGGDEDDNDTDPLNPISAVPAGRSLAVQQNYMLPFLVQIPLDRKNKFCPIKHLKNGDLLSSDEFEKILFQKRRLQQVIKRNMLRGSQDLVTKAEIVVTGFPVKSSQDHREDVFVKGELVRKSKSARVASTHTVPAGSLAGISFLQIHRGRFGNVLRFGNPRGPGVAIPDDAVGFSCSEDSDDADDERNERS
jgi:hypothetical protein